MAAVLSLHAPVATLQRDLVDLLGKAIADLDDTGVPLATRVHELRKRLKRARAWAQLLPVPLDRSVDRALRDVHHRLAARRDLDATLEAIARLLPVTRGAHRDAAAGALVVVRRYLHRSLDADATATSVGGVRDALAALRAVLDGAALEGDFPLLATGLAGIARRSRRAMRRAIASGDPRDFHRWRKWMKYHMFHLRYVTPLWPDLLRVEAMTADHVAEWLGQSQDLELVRQAIAQAPLDDGQRHAAIAVVDREQHRLLRQAASAGLHLHAESPRAFGRRLRNYWRARLPAGAP